MIKTNLSNANIQLAKVEKNYKMVVERIAGDIKNGTGEGHEFLGWRDWPNQLPGELLTDIQKKAAELHGKGVFVLVVIGIGGSYLGAKAAIEAINGLYSPKPFRVMYAGNTLSPTYLQQLMTSLARTPFAINVVSKSGGTLEPAVSFRMFRDLLEQQVGVEEAKTRIIATTDKAGTLRDLANKHGYATFTIPSDIGGRYSVLTPVGLFPMAFAGINIQNVIEGAKMAVAKTQSSVLSENEAFKYAVGRHVLYTQRKYPVELFVGYELQLQALGEWWKQLFGESEGKNAVGLFPAAALFTTDLHSLGQFVQSGARVLFETVLTVRNDASPLSVPATRHGNDDKLDYLTSRRVAELNEVAYTSTLQAHALTGAVPNIVLELSELSDKAFGYFVQFMFVACAMSAYLLPVNPFDQPGVEVYKKNINAQLAKQ